MTLWLASEVGDNQMAKREILSLFSGDDPFGTPKPEKLLERIVQIATQPGAASLSPGAR
jgi:adenine-specific DNA-methyltransferase